MAQFRTSFALSLITLTAMLLLSACDDFVPRQEGSLEESVYRGKPDTPLQKQQVEELRRRARLQSGLTV